MEADHRSLQLKLEPPSSAGGDSIFFLGGHTASGAPCSECWTPAKRRA